MSPMTRHSEHRPSSPPPPYHLVENPPPEANSRDPESISKPAIASPSESIRLKLILAVGSLAIVAILGRFLWTEMQKHNQCGSIPDPAERARIVSEWQQERDAFALESHDWETQRLAYWKDEIQRRSEIAEWRSERPRLEYAFKQWEELERSDFEVEKGRARKAFEAEKEVARKMFEDERRGWVEERQEWAEDARKHREELEQWAAERRQHEEEMIQWAGERAREMSKMWDYPQGEECHAYDLRQYSVRLDVPAVCNIVPVTVENRIAMPETCEVQDGQVVGRYKASGGPFCKFEWNEIRDKQCTTRGQITGIRTFEARLRGLHHNGHQREHWHEVCYTTPAEIHGHYFSQPTRCKHEEDGMSGEFDVDDPTCTWDDLRNRLKEMP